MELRDYQKEILNNILNKGNSLVILPTGLGKTFIAFELINRLLTKLKHGFFLFLAPTKPLVNQHYSNFKKYFKNINNIYLISGDIPKINRSKIYSLPTEYKIIFATPQTIKNDIENKLIDPNLIKLCIFDECHRAVGNYAYTIISNNLNNAYILGLTASPGGKLNRIKEIMSNLKIKNVEIKYSSDKDVKKYLNNISIFWKYTFLTPDLLKVKSILDDLIKKYLNILYSFGLKFNYKSKKDLLVLRNKILKIPNLKLRYLLLTNFFIFFNLNHMVELLETQGKTALLNYINKLYSKSTKTSKILINKKELLLIKHILENTNEEHPKLNLLVDILKKEQKKTIIFVQYRDQIKFLNNYLVSLGFNSRIFVGKKEFTRKEQEKVINDFRSGLFDILITSSIGEEGLDIPAVDRIIFYEPVPSEIRSIQRRGRTGRFRDGEVYILITKKTRDEYFYWSSIKKEKMMKYYINKFIKTGSFNKKSQSSLRKFL